MPSVLFISLMNGAPWGGSEELWYKTALHALQKGWKVGCAVYHWPSKENKLNALTNAGASLFYLPNKGITKRDLIERIQYKITKKIKLKRYISSLPVDEYDLVVVNLGAFEIITPIWKDFYRRLKNYALLFHNYNEEQIFKPEQAEDLKAWLQNASINLFASKRIPDVLERKLNIVIDNGEVFINPITFDPPDRATTYPQLKEGNYCFVMLAALEVYRKAQDQLIEALSSSKWKQRNWMLELYGEGKDEIMLATLIKKNNVADKIFLKGHTDDVRNVLQHAHLVLQLTHLDAMPLAVVEAMAMSRALVVSNVGDMPEWVHNEVNGWISSDASVEEIDQTLEKAWQQKDRWKEMGLESFRIFKSKFIDQPQDVLWRKLVAMRDGR